jgi:ribosome-associated heat shock protein Hsp15
VTDSGRDEALDEPSKVRLDRWLWAARFYKTRSAAKAAVDGGKVHCGGQRAKPSKEVGVGTELVISRGSTTHTVVITGIGERRGTAAAASSLYRETPESVAAREAAANERRRMGTSFLAPPARPDRRDRRELVRLKQSRTEEPEL